MREKIYGIVDMSNACIKANKLVGITVDRVNEDAVLDAADILVKENYFIKLGIKNTSSIPKGYIQKLLESNKYVWHTIDKMADGGRAIDIDLINPVTGKIMTGSSSATAINVLYGINDIGIGTDGGGSVLAVALSTNLFSIMAKGMGLKSDPHFLRKSTDGIEFLPGIGVMSHSMDMVCEGILDMLGIGDFQEDGFDELFKKFKIAVPERGNIFLPSGEDMVDKLEDCIKLLKQIGINIKYEKFPDFKNRYESIETVKKLFEDYDMLITYEGPVDFQGIGDSVLGSMGSFAKNVQNLGGKYMVKIANMLNSTAVTIPSSDAASGIVIISREGLENGMNLLKLSKKITSLYRLPNLYYEYFKNSNRRRKNEFIFSTR